MTIFRVFWNYRGFILGSVKREFQTKYQNSLLGAAWNVINPLAMIIVYTVIFSQVMKARMEGVDSTFGFGIYLCAGILTWGLFAEITGRSQNIFIENANLLKKMNFPRLCLPVIVVLGALLVSYVIYTTDANVIRRYGTDRLYLTVPFVVAGVLRYLQIALVEERAGSPTDLAVGDRFLLVCVLGWVAVFGYLIYA